MFVKGHRGYSKDGGQRAEGSFLMIFQDPAQTGLRPELRALVRFVRMRQLGHYMMGMVRVAGQQISLSGTYGDDGLPISLDHKGMPKGAVEHIWERLVAVPAELQKVFWEGGGHNCAGSEGSAFLDWATLNLKELQKTISKWQS